MPSSTLDDLADTYTQVSLINKRLLDECEIVGQAFHRQGIEFIVLKGADLLSRLYGMRGTRPLSDVDLLMPTSTATPFEIPCKPRPDREVTASAEG